MVDDHRTIRSTALTITVLVVALALSGVGVASLTSTASAAGTNQPTPIAGSYVPQDTDCDGLYEDINHDGNANVVDVQAMFSHLDSIEARDDATMFDINDNGGVSVVDVQAMFAGNTGDTGSSLDLCTVEQRVHHYINQERTSRGLNAIDFDTELAKIARYHSEEMADDNAVYHTTPGGEEVPDRYHKFGYECRASIDSGGFATYGENVAQTYYKARFNGGKYYSTEDELARGIVSQWMHSKHHRENILKPYWNNEGLGLQTAMRNGHTEVFITEDFC